MKFFQKLYRDFARDKQTLKTLKFRQKLRFMYDYYRGRAFVLLLIGLIGFYCADLYLTTQRETILEGFFTNDEHNLFPAKAIADEFSNVLGLTSKQQVIFDDSLFIQPGSSVNYHAASQSKIVAYVAARELDFLVTTKELMEYYSSSFSLYDLEALLPEKLFLRLQDQLYYAVDGTGMRKACAVSMAGSRFDNGTEGGSHYMMVLSYTQHQDALIRFLEYAFPM